MRSKAIRNPEGIWINTKDFRRSGINFNRNNYYCSHHWDSYEWLKFWKEERKRCINGYSVGGVKITGEHYFYLNYCPIQKVENPRAKITRKITAFPDFRDGDYNYFWCREIAKKGITKSLKSRETNKKKLFDSLYLDVKIDEKYLEGGYNLIVGKSRRKGYSYKNSSIGVNNYLTKPKSLTIYNAYLKKYLYPKGIFTMSYDLINFINKHTAWIMPTDTSNRVDHIKSSYITYENGVKIEQGFKSELSALTCNDDPDTNRGKDAEDIFIEEAGAFGSPGLLKSLYAASEDCVKAGSIKTGMITIFGTSGDIESGTADYAEMFLRPLAFNLLPFKNIWDDGLEETNCGFFHPISWNMEGFYDEEGNSDSKSARQFELLARENLIKNGASSLEIQRRMQDNPLSPSEAFTYVSVNNFPVAELKKQLLKVKAKDLQNIKGTPVEFQTEDGEVKAKPILSGKAKPITAYKYYDKDISGCPIIYEFPVPNSPRGLYKIGYDPVRQDTGTSLAGIIVFKGVHVDTTYHNIIVAEYIGRKDQTDDMDKIAEYFADYYNTTIMYENEVTSVKNYFRRIKRLNLLSMQPDAVISKNIKKSTVARIFGCHMNSQLKDAGERYVKDWLTTVLDFDENDNPIRTIDKIYSERLLEELINYNRKGNFDLISALFMCMFQVQEEALGKTYSEDNINKNAKKLVGMIDKMFN